MSSATTLWVLTKVRLSTWPHIRTNSASSARSQPRPEAHYPRYACFGRHARPLSTIHSAKGLEWDAVFVINVMDGRIPHSRACSNPATLEEERRLLYVAVTRARHALYLTYPVHTVGGLSHYQGKCSRFLESLTADDVDRIVLR